jgi:DNA replication protein DnaC
MSDQTAEIVSVLVPRIAPRTPEQQAEAERRKAAAMEAERQTHIATLRQDWGAPERHVKTAPVEAGEWGSSLRALKGRLGTGMLAALIGGRGSGKTQLAVELMRETTNRLKSARFMTAVDFFMRVKETYGRDAAKSEREILNHFCKCSLLVIDEIGKRGQSEWENTLLFELINRRYNEVKDTLIIDNNPAQEFVQSIGPSIASRMNECGGIIQCNWKSYRE